MSSKKVEKSEVSLMLFLKSLLFSYVLTFILLLILAFIMYKFDISTGFVRIGIIAIYVAATFFAGRLTVKSVKKKGLVCGLIMGVAYFMVLLILSLLINHNSTALGNSAITTLALCMAGGMLGGILAG